MRKGGWIPANHWQRMFLRGASSEVKLLACYLMTCAHSSAAGVVRASITLMAEDLGVERSAVTDGMVALMRRHFVVPYTAEDPAGEVLAWAVPAIVDAEPIINPNQGKAAAKDVRDLLGAGSGSFWLALLAAYQMAGAEKHLPADYLERVQQGAMVQGGGHTIVTQPGVDVALTVEGQGGGGGVEGETVGHDVFQKLTHGADVPLPDLALVEAAKLEVGGEDSSITGAEEGPMSMADVVDKMLTPGALTEVLSTTGAGHDREVVKALQNIEFVESTVLGVDVADFVEPPPAAETVAAAPVLPGVALAEAWNWLAQELGTLDMVSAAELGGTDLVEVACARVVQLGGVDKIPVLIGKVKASSYLCGATPGRDGKLYRLTFAALCRESMFTRIMEGSYDTPASDDGGKIPDFLRRPKVTPAPESGK